ncbi:helix-turn-helix transcriptional regulator [Chromobacterium violaceum]|uniref:helix-turn-helix transcriptional regulator n=1 Tax=Chromobacterium violaceum TaxID=536 RepID=UPI00194FA5BE|nr:LuxR family transcriptional regulator [Chromobacterium violaceum]QRO34111.1 autoinducer binding domain-containing protein [Chromobacterium violaceum]QRQ16086.1 autoinducer binding domain-containing protein [Chromobacterium violaceum]
MQVRVRQLLAEVPPWSAYTLLAIHEQLASLSSANELVHWLEGLREGMPHLPPLLLALAGRGPHMSRLHRIIYNEWPNHWIERFDDPAFRSADPILTGPVQNPVIWSHEIAKIRRPTQSQKRFITACRESGMLHGISFISDEPGHRIVLSLSGQDSESNLPLQQMLLMAWPHIVGCARRLLIPKNRLFELTPRERDVFDLISNGETYDSAAYALGIDDATVKSHVARMLQRYEAVNSRHLIKILLSCSD